MKTFEPLATIVPGGASIASRLADGGATVAIFDLNPKASGADLAVRVDAGDDASLCAGVARVAETFGRNRDRRTPLRVPRGRRGPLPGRSRDHPRRPGRHLRAHRDHRLLHLANRSTPYFTSSSAANGVPQPPPSRPIRRTPHGRPPSGSASRPSEGPTARRVSPRSSRCGNCASNRGRIAISLARSKLHNPRKVSRWRQHRLGLTSLSALPM